jgi:hypothetical protein
MLSNKMGGTWVERARQERRHDQIHHRRQSSK